MRREHVEEVLRRKERGWSHEQLARLAAFYKKMADQEDERSQQAIEGAQDASQEAAMQQVENLFGDVAGEDEDGMEEEGGNPIEDLSEGEGEPEDAQKSIPPFRFVDSSHHISPFVFVAADEDRQGLPLKIFKSKSNEKVDELFTVPPLPFAEDALEPVISKEAVSEHYHKHHKSYAKKLNEALSPTELRGEITEILSRVTRMIGKVQNAHQIRDFGGGFYNHCLFWEQLQPPKEGNQPSGKLAKAIKSRWRSFLRFKQDAESKCSEHFGSGWLWLAVTDSKELALYCAHNQDSPVMWGDVPILGLDLWEHSFYLDYRSDRADYVSKLWKLISWDVVEKRYEEAISGNTDELSKGAAEAGGEPLLTATEDAKRHEMTHTRRHQGVNHAPSGAVAEADARPPSAKEDAVRKERDNMDFDKKARARSFEFLHPDAVSDEEDEKLEVK